MSSFPPFIEENFLLQNQTGRKLFFEVANTLPVIDYHNHLDAAAIAGDLQFRNLTQLWVASDPYKHRAMRINGIAEEGITGEASDEEKFLNWAKTISKTMGNPLFHWSALELKRFFNIDQLLSESNASEIWSHCNSLLVAKDHTALKLVKRCNAETICTSDDILDDFSIHQIATAKSNIVILPSLRADSIININREGFKQWIETLSQNTNCRVRDLSSYRAAINNRLNVLGQSGCVFMDIALDAGFRFSLSSEKVASEHFSQVLNNGGLTIEATQQLTSYIIFILGAECSARNWTLQLHIGAQRHTSTRLRKIVGAAGGYATMGTPTDINSIVSFFDALEQEGKLPKTILYNLNPIENQAFATLTGSFAEEGVAGKIQFGPAWWYNDHVTGIVNHLVSLANYGLLYHFIGMTTDSRSFLSLSRHEYFRRIFCNLLGEWIEEGSLPHDEQLLREMVTAVCYGNAKKYFKSTTL